MKLTIIGPSQGGDRNYLLLGDHAISFERTPIADGQCVRAGKPWDKKYRDLGCLGGGGEL